MPSLRSSYLLGRWELTVARCMRLLDERLE